MSGSVRHGLGRIEAAKTALQKYRPDIYRDVRSMKVFASFREAGQRLGVEVPLNAKFAVLADIAEAARMSADPNMDRGPEA